MKKVCGEGVGYTRVVEVPVLSASPSLASGAGSGTALVITGAGSSSFFLKFVMIAYSTCKERGGVVVGGGINT